MEPPPHLTKPRYGAHAASRAHDSSDHSDESVFVGRTQRSLQPSQAAPGGWVSASA